MPLADLDESAARAGLEEAKRNLASAGSDAKAAAVAQISIDTFNSLLLALGAK